MSNAGVQPEVRGPRAARIGAVLARFGPPVAWMGVITVLSSSLFGADQTGSWILPILGRLLPGASPVALDRLHGLIRKMGHVVEYGILAILWQRALAPRRTGRRATAWALALSASYAALDEARQGLTPNRTPSGWDVALDTAGAALALILWNAAGIAWLLRAARWLALTLAGASLVAAGVEWSLGLAPWDLALAALGLIVVAWGLRRVEPAWPPGPLARPQPGGMIQQRARDEARAMEREDLSALPGGDLVRQGLEDLTAGRESEAALLVLIGAPRLRRLGLDVPAGLAAPVEHRLYLLLARSDPDTAHSRYNALVRRLVRFERAMECGASPTGP